MRVTTLDETAFFRNHEERIRALERGSGIGIRFNVDNEGGWLYVIANNSIDLDVGDHGIVFWDATGEGLIVGSGSAVGFGSAINLNGDGINVEPFGYFEIYLSVSGSFKIRDHSFSTIFEVDEDGTIIGGSFGAGTIIDGGSP